MSINVDNDYLKVMAVIVGMNLQLFYYSREISTLRKRYFNEPFMARYFGDIHKYELQE